ncbi:hypothetical protein CCACVL1_17765 [Corchorus capsularis]|uniref:Uncharacterized protein n=1 Tax=Corchorus capsularis TaxID=210143 RepID=A0A1R3HQD6_COCAP|nr:hypothetical protein CCACVL1_17765 [Corchorus capsularis]
MAPPKEFIVNASGIDNVYMRHGRL